MGFLPSKRSRCVDSPQPLGEHARWRVLFLWFGLFFALVVPEAYSQQYPFIPVTAPNAPQGCMFPFEDHNGGLWLAGCEAGSEGLYFFDGTRFLLPLKDAFPKVIVRGMVEDTEGGLWIASSGGIYRYEKGKLQKKFDGIALAGITHVASDVFLTALARSPENSLRQAAMTRISRVNGEWKAESMLQPVPQLQYRLDRIGHILYGCDDGYCELSVDDVVGWKAGTPIAIAHRQAAVGRVYSDNLSVVWRDQAGCIWWRNHDSASYQCPSDHDPVRVPANLAGLGVPGIVELPDGTIGIPSYGKLVLGRPGNLRGYNATNGCPNAMMLAAGKDGSLWIASTSGLFVFPLHTKLEFWSARDGLNSPVWSVLHADKNVYALADVSTRILDDDRSHWRSFNRGFGRIFPGPAHTSLITSVLGIVQIDARGNVLRRSPPIPVWLSTYDQHGNVWAAGTGVFRLTPDGSSFRTEARAPGQEFIQGLRVDPHGGLWTCSSIGLSHLTESGWRTLTTADGLLQNGCGSMTQDQDGDIWYGYDTVPVFARIHDPASQHPQIQQYENEGTKNRTYFFASDRRGWLWRGTPDGLYVADLQQARQGQWLHMNRADGLPAVDTNQHSFSEDSDGSVWFGAEDAAIHIYPPDDLVYPNYQPSVFVSAFSLNNTPAQMASLTEEIKSGSDVVAHIGSLQFDRRNALLLRYRVLPEQSSWATQRAFDIHMGKLGSGKHTLEIQAQLGSGPWSTPVAQSFTVLKPIWLTWPAILGFVAIGGLGLGGASHWRKKRAARSAKSLPALGEWRLQALSPEVWPLAGTVLDSRFEVGSVLARGGFATVAQGKDLQQGRRACAIKIFRQDLMDKDWVTRRFQQEVRALEKILHPNVVRIYGHGMTPNGSPYLVMEFIAGETLQQKLEGGSLPPQQTASYLRQAGDALEEIHRHGICHRDLKPENLMIRKDVPAGHDLVLIDFSIAIVQDPDVTLHGLSRAAGTIYYMAPEQSIGYADSSTDVYSLAKIVIEMLTGERLTTLLPDASMDLPDRVREKLAELNLGLSSASIDYISSALEFDPSRRPKSARAFANQIANDLSSVSNHA